MRQSPDERKLSDAELVRRARDGTATAFAELVTRYQDRVFNTCFRMCHNHEDALDFAQAAFVKAFENLARFRGGASFYTWLFRIVVNLVLSGRRAALRRTTIALDGAGGGARPLGRLADHREPGAASAGEARELQQRVASALEQLDDEFRAAVVLKDIEEMDYAAIAEVLGVPVGTVKSRIHRGRLMLRELLRAERAYVDRR